MDLDFELDNIDDDTEVQEKVPKTRKRVAKKEEYSCTIDDLTDALMNLVNRHKRGVPDKMNTYVKDSDMIRACEVLLKVKLLEQAKKKDEPDEIIIDF